MGCWPKTYARWRKLAVMQALGHRGPILLEDANDMADIVEWQGKIPTRLRWVDEFRQEIEYEHLMRI